MTSTPLNTTSPELAPHDHVALIRQATALQAAIKSMQLELDACKAQLNLLHNDGSIPDKLSTPYGTATLTTRVTHQYSAAVKQLQEMEILEGIAIKKVSSSWTIRPATPEQLDF
jgi:hypothetical protein